MKRIGLFLVSAMFCLSMTGQNIDGRLLVLNQKHATIVASFTEQKVMPRLKKEVKKEGVLYFAHPDALSMVYSTPEGDRTLIKDGRFMVRRSGKVQKFAMKNEDSPMYLLRNILLYSFCGDVKRIASECKASLESKESSTRFLFTITKKVTPKTGVCSIQLIYDKITGAIISLRLDEVNGNYTIYETDNAVQGQVIPEAVWTIE